jgi:8-oxo-dGTP diphosphatase / 2-hydroxy-dATP diphosphatase
MRNATLCYIFKDKKVLLGLKKRGFAEGVWNGYGGKVDFDETIEEAVIREMKEESTVVIKEFEKFAELDFIFKEKTDWNQRVHVFIADKWSGNPVETEEMTPQWFNINDLPKDKMWSDDVYWVPLVFDRKKVKATFYFADDNKTIEKHELEEVQEL